MILLYIVLKISGHPFLTVIEGILLGGTMQSVDKLIRILSPERYYWWEQMQNSLRSSVISWFRTLYNLQFMNIWSKQFPFRGSSCRWFPRKKPECSPKIFVHVFSATQISISPINIWPLRSVREDVSCFLLKKRWFPGRSGQKHEWDHILHQQNLGGASCDLADSVRKFPSLALFCCGRSEVETSWNVKLADSKAMSDTR